MRKGVMTTPPTKTQKRRAMQPNEIVECLIVVIITSPLLFWVVECIAEIIKREGVKK